MDKRVLGLAVLAMFIGIAVMFVEVMLVGVLASQAGPMPHDITLSQLQWRGLWQGVVFISGLPSALGALLIASFKPRLWALYSACAILPMAVVIIAGIGPAPGYHLLSGSVNLAILPSFLGLYYLVIRRHSKL